jgi:hypothetical protein
VSEKPDLLRHDESDIYGTLLTIDIDKNIYTLTEVIQMLKDQEESALYRIKLK